MLRARRALFAFLLLLLAPTADAGGAGGAVSAVSAVSALSAKEQVVVFDAGSSGTRVHVYDFEWRGSVTPVLDAGALPVNVLVRSAATETVAKQGVRNRAHRRMREPAREKQRDGA